MFYFASDFRPLESIVIPVILNAGYFLILILSSLLRLSPAMRESGIAIQRFLALAGWGLLAAVIFFTLPAWERFGLTVPIMLIGVTFFAVWWVNAIPKNFPETPSRKIRPGKPRPAKHDPDDY